MFKLANLKMRQKLLVLLCVPFLCLIAFAVASLYRNMAQLRTMSDEKTLSVIVPALDHFYDAFLETKESANVFSLTKSPEASQSLEQGKSQMAEALNTLQKINASSLMNSLDPKIKFQIQQLIEHIGQRTQNLNHIDFSTMTHKDLLALFLPIENEYMQTIHELSLGSTDVDITRSLMGYLLALQNMNAFDEESILLSKGIIEKNLSPELYQSYQKAIWKQQIAERFLLETLTPEEQEEYKNTVKGEFLNQIAKFRATISEQGISQAATLDWAEWHHASDAKKENLSLFIDKLQNHVSQYTETMIKKAWNQLFWTTLGILLITIATAILTYAIVKSITVPLEKAVLLAREVGEGRLVERHHAIERKDEIGELEAALQKMVLGLKATTLKLQEEVDVLATSSQEIVASIADVSSGTAETATAVTETTTTVEELRQTGQISAEKAKDVQTSAEDALKILNSSEKSLNTTIDDMHQIQQRMTTISESIIKLSEHSQTIGKIIDTVNDLAEQSNLLAVNAAIEAAKAGDQGKGFAVVADEVRRLAEQSKQATVQVHTILNDIQNATSSAVMATEQGAKAVTKGVAQSLQTTEAIRSLSGGINKVAHAATQITVSSQQQLIGAGQVTVAMSNIREASQQHVSHMQQIETAVSDLDKVGQNLKELVDQYRLS